MNSGLFGNELTTTKDREDLVSYKSSNFGRIFLSVAKLTTFILLVIVGMLFLPWTQNIKGTGKVTALRPESRPQKVNSVIAGRIEKWYVQEGDYVDKGDTLLFISEIKDEYFDPALLERTRLQIKAKEQKVISYQEKVRALERQIEALNETRVLKLEQTKNKLEQAKLKYQSDSIKLEAAESDNIIRERQFRRFEELNEKDIITDTKFEDYRQKYMDTKAKYIDAKNTLLASENSVLNAQIEYNSIDNQYLDKLSKAESEKNATLANLFESEAEVTKLQNQYSNYTVRQGYYYITAPQSGYITQAVKTGIGENIKENEEIVSIMPSELSMAAELYFDPLDMPLLEKGHKVRLVFDGWPTIVFSGWPNTSFGTFGGVINAVDRFSSKGGKFRVLVEPDTTLSKEWPQELRLNGGAVAYVLLNDVPIWYEIWRQFNGFPADFYATTENTTPSSDKSK